MIIKYTIAGSILSVLAALAPHAVACDGRGFLGEDYRPEEIRPEPTREVRSHDAAYAERIGARLSRLESILAERGISHEVPSEPTAHAKEIGFETQREYQHEMYMMRVRALSRTLEQATGRTTQEMLADSGLHESTFYMARNIKQWNIYRGCNLDQLLWYLETVVRDIP